MQPPEEPTEACTFCIEWCGKTTLINYLKNISTIGGLGINAVANVWLLNINLCNLFLQHLRYTKNVFKVLHKESGY